MDLTVRLQRAVAILRFHAVVLEVWERPLTRRCCLCEAETPKRYEQPDHAADCPITCLQAIVEELVTLLEEPARDKGESSPARRG
jgi:hypothetical protein